MPAPLPTTAVRRPSVPQLAPTVLLRVCPECAGPLVHASGCIACAQCGWSRCG